jgi:hypothetical protein
MSYQQILELFVLGSAILAVIGIACLAARAHRKMIDKRFPPLILVKPASPESEHLMDYTYANPPMKEAADSAQPAERFVDEHHSAFDDGGTLMGLFKPQVELIRKDKA